MLCNLFWEANPRHIVIICDIKVRSQVTIPSIQGQARLCNCGMVMLYCFICKPVLTSTILTCTCFYSHSPEIYIQFNSIYVHCMNRYIVYQIVNKMLYACNVLHICMRPHRKLFLYDWSEAFFFYFMLRKTMIWLSYYTTIFNSLLDQLLVFLIWLSYNLYCIEVIFW